MIDRFNDLSQFCDNPSLYIPPSHTLPSDLPLLNPLRQAQHNLYRVKKSTFRMRELKNAYTSTATAEQELQLKSNLRSLVSFNNSELNKTRKIVESLSESLQNPDRFDSVDFRLLSTMNATLLKQFQDAVADSELAQNEFNDYARFKISGQLRMVNEEIDEETIEKCIEDPKYAQMIVNKELIGGHSNVIEMVNDIEDRLEDIKMLEANIGLMHRMFLDLAALVEGQGELLNSIEGHVDKAKDYVAQGIRAIEKAEEQLKSARWKKCCVLIAILLIATIITVPILAVKFA